MSNIIHEIQLFYAQNEDKDFFDEILLVGFGVMPREHVADIRVFELPAGFDVREYLSVSSIGTNELQPFDIRVHRTIVARVVRANIFDAHRTIARQRCAFKRKPLRKITHRYSPCAQSDFISNLLKLPRETIQ